MVPEVRNERQIFCHLGTLIAPLLPNNLENQTFEKRKKLSGDVITLHMCTKSHDKMMYAS